MESYLRDLLMSSIMTLCLPAMSEPDLKPCVFLSGYFFVVINNGEGSAKDSMTALYTSSIIYSLSGFRESFRFIRINCENN